MLDDVTKKRINSLRQILVGKLPDPKAQVEQITNGLIYKFMNDMDEEAINLGGNATYFSGKYEKYSWKNLMNSKTDGSKKVELYSEAIKEMYKNENLPELFRDIFKDSFLPFQDPSTLSKFLKDINEFHYSNSEKLGDAFEYLLSFMGSQGDAGQFRTPRHIIDFIIKIVNPQKNETILDPACGTAGFLISSYKHILNQNTKKNLGDELSVSDRKKIGENLNGYDISPDMVKMSLVNLYLHKFANPKINEYDTLSSEDRWNEYYDVILANPPFFSPKGGITPHNRFGVNSSKAEVLFVDYINEHLKPSGRAGIIVPEGIVFQNGIAYKQLRKKLIQSSLIGVISLPAGVFQPYSGVKTSILILDKSKNKTSENIFFIDIKNDGYELNAKRTKIRNNKVNDLEKTIFQLNNFEKNKKTENSDVKLISKKEILNNENFLLTYKQYEKFTNLNSNTKFLKLEDTILTLSDGDWIESKDQSESGIRLIQTGNIGEGNFLNKDNKSRYISEETFKKLKCTRLKKGQILLSRLPEPVGRCCFVPERQEKMITSVDVSILEFNEKILLNRFFLYLSLSSNYKNEIVKYLTGASRQRISKENLKKISLPCPSIETQNQIVEELDGYQKIIDGCKQILENYKPSIQVETSWETIELGQLCSLMTGGTPKTDNNEFYENGDIPWLVSGDIHKVEIHNTQKFITKKGMENSNTKFLPVNSVLIALNGQGKTRGTVAILRVKATCNQSIVSIKPNDENVIKTEFLYLYLNSIYKDIRNLTGDNQRSGLNMPIIRKIKIPLAPIEEQIKFINMWNSEKNMIDISSKTIKDFQNKIKSRIEKIWS